ncbi:unnamed protein product [Prorocentrum cordatum]|uniref:DOC domain-containing protein n=1 Tax=Prorocentrum cordatum TaxID=2364126 RepID=A0ABN9VBU6_9DINO|nr:unnamed protein product [Polarella glacialis]
MAELREVGDEAAWSLSSAKPGNGVEQLRDGNTETFWQSDGPQPHLINIQFQRKLRVSELRIFTNHKVDESYTPSCISVRIGTAHHDLQEIQVIDLREPDGWITVRLARSLHEPAPEEATPWCVPRDPDMGGAADFSSWKMEKEEGWDSLAVGEPLSQCGNPHALYPVGGAVQSPERPGHPHPSDTGDGTAGRGAPGAPGCDGGAEIPDRGSAAVRRDQMTLWTCGTPVAQLADPRRLWRFAEIGAWPCSHAVVRRHAREARALARWLP